MLKDIHKSELEKIHDYLRENKLFYSIKQNSFLTFFLFKKTQNLIFNFVKYKMHKEPKIENNIYNNFNLILKTSVSLTKNGGNFYFVFLPSIKRYKNNYNIDEDYLKLKSIIKKQNINFIDVNEEIQKLVKDPVSFIL